MAEVKKTVTKAAAKTAEVKKAEVKETVKSAEKAAVKEAAKPAEKAAVKAAAKPAAKAAAKPAAKTAAKPAAKKTTKPAAKKAPAKKVELKTEVYVQFAGKSYAQEDLLDMAKDVWKYDLKQKVGSLTSVELYVKPEENMVYYVMNQEFTGSFYI